MKTVRIKKPAITEMQAIRLLLILGAECVPVYDKSWSYGLRVGCYYLGSGYSGRWVAWSAAARIVIEELSKP